MKILISLIIILFQANMLFRQISELEKCGLDNNAMLNSYEAAYFNDVFKERKEDFNFSGKVIAFYTGSSGTTMSTKSRYFNSVKNSNQKDVHAWQAGGTQLLILDNEEKNLSGGYDAILVLWSKLPKRGKSRTRLVKRLKNKASHKI